MFEQKRLGDNGTRAARSEKFDDRGDEMNKQLDQVAHRAIVAISTNVTRLGYPQDLCDKSEIRHTQVARPSELPSDCMVEHAADGGTIEHACARNVSQEGP